MGIWPREGKRTDHFLVRDGNNDIVGGFGLVRFDRFMRLVSVFILPPHRHRGHVPRMLAMILDRYSPNIMLRAREKVLDYWKQYADVCKVITPNMTELSLSAEKIREANNRDG